MSLSKLPTVIGEGTQVSSSPTSKEVMTTYKGLTPEQRQAQYRADRALIRKAKKTQVQFIGSDLLIKMGINILGGCTGKGKSTCAANMIADFNKRYPDRQVLVISNEENSADAIDRIACIQQRIDFYKYREALLPEATMELVEDYSSKLVSRIEIAADSGVDMTCLEDVIDVLNYAATQEHIKLIVIDYLQTVTWSRRFPGNTAYEVSKKLGLFLKDYGRKVSVPVIVFAQLKPAPESDSDWKPDMAERIQGDKTFANHAVMTIEIIPDFEASTTKFYIHKDRFGNTQGNNYEFDWKQGRLIEVKAF